MKGCKPFDWTVLIPALFLTVALTGALWAQSNFGTIVGVVRDQSGAVVPGAEVTATNTATGIARTIVSNDEGAYRMPSMQPGVYSLKAAIPGFKTAQQDNLKVDTASTLTVEFRLEVGEQSQVVEVSATGNTPIIQRADAEMSQLVSEKAILDLPSPGRNTLALALSAPGVVGEAGSENPGIYVNDADPGSGLGIGGARLNSTVMMVDGANITGVGRNRAIMTFSPDVTSEFKVITNNFSAEYNSFGGGIIQTTTKSGTNEFHGTGYWFHRQRALAARTFGESLYVPTPEGQTPARKTCPTPGCDKPPLRRHNVGITAGGPVWIPKLYDGRGKTFFFAAFEPTRYWVGTEAILRVPDAAVRNGDFSGLRAVGKPWNAIFDQFNQDSNGQLTLKSTDPNFKFSQFPNNKIPAERISPVGKKLVDLYPLPNWPLDASGNNYRAMRSVDGNDNRRSFKVDHQLTDQNTFNVRYSFNPIFAERYWIEPRDYFFLTGSYFVSHNVVLNDTHTFSPSFVNNFIFNWNNSDFSTDFPNGWKDKSAATELGMPTMFPNYGAPKFTTGFNPNIFDKAQDILTKKEGGWQISETFSWLHGNHSFRFGGQIMDQYLKSNGALYEFYKSTGGLWGFSNKQTTSQLDGKGTGGDAAASFLLGVPDEVQIRSNVVDYHYKWKTYGGFFQDDWKVTPNVTLNLGVRWDMYAPRDEKNHYQAYQDYKNPIKFNDASGKEIVGFRAYYAGVGEARDYLESFPKKNIAPRLGVAWSPNAGGPLSFLFGPGRGVIRAGYGVIYAGRTGLNDKASPELKAKRETQKYNAGLAQFKDKIVRLGSNYPQYDPEGAKPYFEVPASGYREPWDPYIPGALPFDETAGQPYTHNWNFNIQWPIGNETAVTVGYIGAQGRNLPTPAFPQNIPTIDAMEKYWAQGINPATYQVDNPLGQKDANGTVYKIPLIDTLRPYYGAGNMALQGVKDSHSYYNAMQIRLERRFASGYQFNVNYTLSKSIDDASDANEVGATGSSPVSEAFASTFQWPLDRRLDRAVSNFDQTHILNYYFIAELPFGPGKSLFSDNRFLGQILGGWQFAGNGRVASGVPYQINLGHNNGLPWYGGRLAVRPDIVEGVPLVNPEWTKGNYWDVPYINPAAFSQPAFGKLGNAPRTIDRLRFPRKTTFDLSVMRNFRPFSDESKYIQLRAEAYNLFNHPLFNIQSGAVSLFGSAMQNRVSLTEPNKYAGPIANYYGADNPNWTQAQKDMNTDYNNGWGKISAVGESGRVIQLALKIYW